MAMGATTMVTVEVMVKMIKCKTIPCQIKPKLDSSSSTLIERQQRSWMK